MEYTEYAYHCLHKDYVYIYLVAFFDPWNMVSCQYVVDLQGRHYVVVYH